MPTTISTIAPVRRVAVGVSATAQGLDGVAELTRTAFEALGAAEWTISADAPTIPVHEYDRPVPTGDAWKACYGYDAGERTERGAAGAVCYTFAVPADALTGDPCEIASVALSVQGDRYLDAGADLHVVFSADPTPPSVAELLARTPDETGLCATSGQTAAPNQRHGVTAPVTISPTSQAATAYVHVALLLTDYLGARGAWIEGGAMLVSGAATITFSRDVAETTESTPLISGKATVVADSWELNRRTALPTMHYGASYYAFMSGMGSQVSANDLVRGDLDAIAALDVADEIVVPAFVNPNSPTFAYFSWQVAPWYTGNNYTTTVAQGKVADGVTFVMPTIRVLARSFAPMTGRWTGVDIDTGASETPTPITAANPIDVSVWGVPRPCTAAIPHDDILRESFWTGPAGERDLKVVSGDIMSESAIWSSGSDTPVIASATIPAIHLAYRLVPRDGTLSHVDFDVPFRPEWAGAIILAVRPSAWSSGGASRIANSTSIPDTLKLTLTRTA